MPVENPINNGLPSNSLKRTCPYCDVVFVLAILLSVAALILSLLQEVRVILALIVFITILANCFCKTQKWGLVAAGLVQLSCAVYYATDLVQLKQQQQERSLVLLIVNTALWLFSGILTLHFVFGGRVKNYIKEGLEIEAVATPVESIDDDVEDLELGSDDDGSVSTGSERDSHSDNDSQSTGEQSQESNVPEQRFAASPTTCEIPEVEIVEEEMSEERRAKLQASVPLTSARPMDESERSTVSYLPCGLRDWDSDRR